MKPVYALMRVRLLRERDEESIEMFLAPLLAFVSVFLSLVASFPIDSFAQDPNPSLVELGQRLYLEGISVNGQPVRAISQHDIPITGKTAACVKCHRASGFGSSEGGYYVPPITGPLLFSPRKLDRERLFPDMFQQVQPPTFSARLHQPHMRPAYTTESLGVTLREGRDPGGQELAAIMPRYQLTDEDIIALSSYLQTLSAQLSPGVDDREIHFVMVMSEDVPAMDQKAVLETMRRFVDWHNRHLRHDRSRPNFSPLHRSPFVPLERFWKFTVLTLKGAQDSWGRQVQDFYQVNPFFAIVGGLVHGEWESIAGFCDSHGVPCILPITDLPVAGVESGYSVYFSEGLALEAKVLADHLLKSDQPVTRVMQLAATDSFGQTPARILQEKLAARYPELFLRTFTFRDAGELSTKLADLSQMLTQTDAMVVWPGARVESDMNTVLEVLPLNSLLFLPSRTIPLMSKKSLDQIDRLRFVEPHEISVTSHPRSFLVRAWMRTRGLDIPRPTLQFETYYALSLLEAAMMNIREDYHREYLIERIERESEKDLNPGIYPRMTLGPTQRYASKGAFIVRLDSAQPGGLIPVSNWIVP